jgi:hypothetical protein
VHDAACVFENLFGGTTEFPEQNPTIDDIKQYYSIGDYLETNCTSNSSIPPAQLEWWINDVPAHIEHIIKYETIIDSISNRETSILGLRLPLTNEHFYQGRLKVSTSELFQCAVWCLSILRQKFTICETIIERHPTVWHYAEIFQAWFLGV